MEGALIVEGVLVVAVFQEAHLQATAAEAVLVVAAEATATAVAVAVVEDKK